MKSNILISSIVDSPIDTLFYLIHNLYSPVIQCQQSKSNTKGIDVYDSKLTSTLADLESNLKIAIRRSEHGDSKRTTLSPLDEIQYWADMSEKGKSKEAQERASYFYDEFKQLIPHFKKIDSCQINEILEIIESTQDSYDYIWQQLEYEPPYSQDRMINLLDITGMTILKALLNKLSKLKPFEDSYTDVKELLKHSISVCERWIEVCYNLTARIWKQSRAHKWENDPFVPESIEKYCKRLNEVLQIRSAREQYGILIKTVKDDQTDDSKVPGFSFFDSIDPLQYNPFTESSWQESIQNYDRSMNYVDQKTAQILKAHLRQAQSNPRQLLAEFLRYSDLIRRERVKNELTSERSGKAIFF